VKLFLKNNETKNQWMNKTEVFMPLLTTQQKSKKIAISLRFDESLLTAIKSYSE
jgi:hypothetical protein